MRFLLRPISFFLLPCAAAGGASAACAPDALGTSRVLTLKREYAAYGTGQKSMPDNQQLADLARGMQSLITDR